MAPRGYDGHKTNEPREEPESIVREKKYKQLAMHNQPEKALDPLIPSSNPIRPNISGVNVQAAASQLLQPYIIPAEPEESKNK